MLFRGGYDKIYPLITLKDKIMTEKKFVEIYTDGSCLKNPGPGGWGAVLIYNGIEDRKSVV